MSLIVNPGSGEPGQDITVEVELLDDVQLTDVFLIYPGGTVALESPTLTGTVTIPVDRYGSIPLTALGLTDDGLLVEAYPTSINVNQTAAPDYLTTEPAELIFGAPGQILSLRVMAHFPDGIARDLTPVASSLDYSGYNSMVIDVKEDRSAVQAVRAGGTTITVEFSGLFVDVPVTVLDGERSNNPPHAEAGDDESFCGGREFCLDGSESYDDDARFGDALTYRWDLNGDGLFDDAVGETPCVVFEDGSQARVVALEVTDADGVTSVDMAVLSPLAGYCQDAAMSCRVGQDDPAYDNFVGLMEIEPDASGGFHVLVGPWIFPADVRVVSFDDQCGFVDEFVLDQNPHGFAVSPDGIIHVFDGPTAAVRRFEVGGNELASVALPTLPVEQIYQGQDLEIDPDGNLSIAVRFGQVGYAVHTIDDSGTLLRSVAAMADLGIDLASGESIQIHEVGPDGSLYLLSNDALYRVTFDGQYALDLTIPLDDRFAWGNDVAAGADGTMYVANSHGVHRFLVDGTYDSSRTGSAGELFSDIQGIEVDCADRVYVAERRDDAWVIQFADGGTPVEIPVVDDGTVTWSRVFRPATGTEDWVFTWETDVEGDPSLDRVRFGEVVDRCAPPYPQLTVANCDSSDVREAGAGFLHTLVWQDMPCIPRCSIPYYVESGVACYTGQSEWHMIKVMICLKSM